MDAKLEGTPVRAPEGRDAAYRAQVAHLLTWENAHAGYDKAVDKLPAALRGVRADGFPHTPWQLVEHIRIAQRDILDFCRAEDYRELQWPDDYWPPDDGPPNEYAWDGSLAAFRQDRDALVALAGDPGTDLLASVPNGSGQTYLRQFLLAADHTSYHVGQLVAVRKILGAWEG